VSEGGQRAGAGAPRAAALILLVALCLPFLGKAHGIDDPLHLAAARRVLEAPWDPFGGSSFWHERPTTLFHDLYNPPLASYLLALPVAIDGGSELSVHLLMLALACGALLACAWAGEALGAAPRFLPLLAASPALATAALSALTDVPFLLMSALAWGLALRGRLVAAGLLSASSALTKYAGLLNLPLGALAARGRTRRWWLGPLVAVAVFVLYGLWNLATQGELHIAAAGSRQAFGLEQQARLALSLLMALGLAGLPAVLGLLRWTASQAIVALLAGFLGAACLHVATWSIASTLLAAVAAAAGAALLWAAASASRSTTAPTFAVAALWTFAAYLALFVYFGAARYALPLLPPLLWLLERGGRLEPEPSRLRFGASLGIGCGLTLAVLWGDAGHANAWRTAAERLPPASRGFSIGHWGFQWYAAQRGYAPLAPREVLRAGDLVAQPRGVHAQTHSLAHQALLSDRGRIRVPSPAVRVMDRTVGAGFYSDAWGLLPFAVRPGAFEEVSLREVPGWLAGLMDEPLEGAVSLDFGTREASFVCLDGWSSPESFQDGSVRRTFVWAEGAQSAIRLQLPRGVREVTLVVSPDESAQGLLRVAIGEGAEARFELRPGWGRYVAPVEGEVETGMTTVVLEPSGHRRPGLFGRERRPLSVAIDSLEFSSDEGVDDRSMRGVWPVRTQGDRPGLLVAGATRSLAAGPVKVAGRLVVLGGEADITVGGFAWSSRGRADCASEPGCAFELQVPQEGVPAVLRADAAVVTELAERPDAGVQR
jgi:hypothetical protein